MSNIEYVMFEIDFNLGHDIKGKYFVQYTSNENSIDKFIKINQNGNVKFFPEKYSAEQITKLISTLCVFNKLLDLDASDNVECMIFKGEFNIPGENKIYSLEELEIWWREYLVCPKFPVWENFFDEIIDLTLSG